MAETPAGWQNVVDIGQLVMNNTGINVKIEKTVLHVGGEFCGTRQFKKHQHACENIRHIDEISRPVVCRDMYELNVSCARSPFTHGRGSETGDSQGSIVGDPAIVV